MLASMPLMEMECDAEEKVWDMKFSTRFDTAARMGSGSEEDWFAVTSDVLGSWDWDGMIGKCRSSFC